MIRPPTDPIAQFMQEHTTALAQLKNLNKAAREILQDGFSAKRFRLITTALRFMEEEVGVHNRKEEKALFPVLDRYVDGPTRVMLADHRQLYQGFLRLRRSIQRVRDNRDSFSAIRQMNSVAQNVIQLFVNHIHKENYILFPMVQRFLSKAELREIAKRML